MVLALSAMALPDAGTTGAALGASIAYALYKGDTATRISATITVVSNLDTAALYKHCKLVTLAPHNLSNPETEVNVKRQGDCNITQRQGGKSVLSILYKEISKKKKKKKNSNVR
jgi:hypothetical protein